MFSQMKIAFLFAVLVAAVQGFAPVAQPRVAATELGLFGKKTASTATGKKVAPKPVKKGKKAPSNKSAGKFGKFSQPNANKKTMTIFEATSRR